ncbi:hypothetical protein N0A02_33005 (plasmid) [Paraburkholderia acidicola]|uniref:Uncharacterized protein n=1 Tax=Paraburkholderia acidicola TaxID=1912599 RepID=A0ABV1LYA3_9BURK
MVLPFALAVLASVAHADGTTNYDPVEAKAARERYGGPERKLCESLRPTAIENERKAVSKIDGHIESVPPDQVRYLEDEFQKARVVGNGARLELLSRTPFYYSWQLHNALSRLTDSLTSVNQPSVDSPPVHQIKSAAFVASSAQFAILAFKDYSAFDRNRTPRIMSEGQELVDESVLMSVAGDMAQFIVCTADTLE